MVAATVKEDNIKIVRGKDVLYVPSIWRAPALLAAAPPLPGVESSTTFTIWYKQPAVRLVDPSRHRFYAQHRI
jgi:hypothetical protein